METGTTLLGALSAAHFDEHGYATLFARLGAFFRSRGCTDPEDRAGQAILRAMRRLLAGARVERFDTYSYGFASNIVREEWRIRRTEILPRNLALDETFFLGLNRREQAVLLEECLSVLRREDRILIRAYFRGERDELAREHSCSPNALRIRVFRALAAVRERIAVSGDGPVQRAANRIRERSQ